MTETLDKVSTVAPRARSVQVKPAFLQALRGIWLFTWKPQLAWGRLAVTLLTLAVLPVLVYLTTSSPQGWSRQHTLLGPPSNKVNEFAGRLARAEVPMTPQQRAELRRIFEEEFARTEDEFNKAQPGKALASRQREQIVECYERIHDRSRSVLDDGQFERYRDFEKRAVTLAQNGVREARWGRTEPFYHWLIDFYFFVILPLSCVRACGGLIRDEVQEDTLGFLTTRPLSRGQLVLAKFASQTVWVQMLLLVETLLVFAVGGLRQIPGLASLLPLFLVGQFLAVLAWSALGVCLGQATKRYMAAALLYGLVVEVGIGRIPTNINNLSLIKQLKSLLAHDAALQSVYDWSARAVPIPLGALVLAAGIFLAAAALLFTYREYHHTVEMQK
jgi:hypothetical protein